MKILSICKPDILKKDELINEYFNRLINIDSVKNIEIYNLENWALNSLFLYEFDCMNLTGEEEAKKRRELLITAKGYDIVYNEENSHIVLMDIDNRESIFDEMRDLKKQFRRDFVYGREANYLRFLNENFIDFSEKFNKETLLKIKAIVMRYQKQLENKPDDYNLILFNMIHFPDSYEENEYELDYVNNNNLIGEDRMIRRLVK